MSTVLSRRKVLATLAAGSAAAMLPSAFAASKPKFERMPIGYTGITWMNAQVDEAIATVAKLGFYGFETFGDVLEKWEAKGGLKPVLDRNNIPLVSGYCTLNLTDQDKRQETMSKAVQWCGLIKKNGGRIFVLGSNPVKRDTRTVAHRELLKGLRERSGVLAGVSPVGDGLLQMVRL